MAGRKTQETNASVDEFIETLSDEIKRRDCKKLVEIFSAATGQDPKSPQKICDLLIFDKAHRYRENLQDNKRTLSLSVKSQLCTTRRVCH